MKQIGLFGGTFNPIHFGHLRAALEVKTQFALDQIYLIPSAIPPHKSAEGMAAASYRLQMIRLAVTDQPDFFVSDIELKRPGPSFTIDTVYRFKSSLPFDTKLYLVMGYDAFFEIDAWKSYLDLFQIIPFIVISRPALMGTNDWNRFEAYLLSKISADYAFWPAQGCYRHPSKHPIFVFNVTAFDIASTRIRQLVKKKESIRFLVPKAVETFIIAKGLYR